MHSCVRQLIVKEIGFYTIGKNDLFYGRHLIMKMHSYYSDIQEFVSFNYRNHQKPELQKMSSK